MTDNALPHGQDADETGGAAVEDFSSEQLEPPVSRSLTDDITALMDDGKTYVEAELQFQKTRAAFAANHTKSGVGLILGALAFLHLALIGLVVGVIIALMPVLTPIGATALVAGLLLLFAGIFVFLAAKRFKRVGDAFKDGEA